MKKNATKKKAAPKKSRVVKRKTTKNPKAAPVVPVQAAPEATELPTVAAAPAREYKKDIVISLLQRENGATLAQLMSATGWQAHSVRGFISGTLRKKLGLTIERVKALQPEPRRGRTLISTNIGSCYGGKTWSRYYTACAALAADEAPEAPGVH